MRAQHLGRVVLVLAPLLLPPTAARAQGLSATIAGVVTDASGAVLPGVTVEATSPALIEGARVAVTDQEGRYQIIDLRPGPYAVTFTLTGFRTLRREGLGLTAGFAATVNVELSVGTLEETVTVTGEAPLVDTRSIRQQTTFRRDTLEVLPTSQRLAHLVSLIPSARTDGTQFHDVGGLGSDRGQFSVHGQRSGDITWNVAGIDSRIFAGGNFMTNTHTYQEIVVETLAGGAEATTGGVQINIVPREGGNRFSGTFSTEHTASSLQSSNIDEELLARGLQESAKGSVRKYYDTGGGLGGPIARNRLWFFAAHRWLVKSMYQQGNYFNARQNTFVAPGVVLYEPDLTRQGYFEDTYKDTSLRFTWQAADTHKFGFSHSTQPACQCFFQIAEGGAAGTPLRTPEAAGDHHYNPSYRSAVNWTSPATNRLLLEAAAQVNGYFRVQKRPPGVDETIIAIEDIGLNLFYGSRTTGYDSFQRLRFYQRAAASYVTGSHHFKTGVDLIQGDNGKPDGHVDVNRINQGLSYRFRNGVPERVTIHAVPFGTYSKSRQISAFAQDQWTIDRLTLNLGVRYSDFRAWVPEFRMPAGPFVPARAWPAVDKVPHWRNLSPRLGAAYDLFGDGRTAIKASLGHYPPREEAGAVSVPAQNVATSANRNWNDSNRNYVPDCVLGPAVPGANGECGPLSDTTFGVRDRSNTRYAEDALTGLNGQSHNWQGSLVVQHELGPRVGIQVGYYRTWYGGFLATDNLAVTPADFNEYCITAPTDPRLPTSGQRLCGLFDLAPAKFGLVDNLVTQTSHYGKQTEVYNGVDATSTIQFGERGLLQGGLSIGRTVTDNCVVVDSPQAARPGFCKIAPPWAAGTQVRLAVVYPLPWELMASAIYQNLPGTPLRASYVATNAEIAPSLGRNLSGGQATVTIDLFPPDTYYDDRIQQVDIRATRMFRLGGSSRLQANFDLYNIFNENNILTLNTRYGANWLQPVLVMGGRVVKVSARFNF